MRKNRIDKFLPYEIALAVIFLVIFAVAIVVVHQGEQRRYRLYYFAPIVIPVVGLISDRYHRKNELTRLCFFTDIFVSLISLSRAFYPLPLVSGHAFFLTYCILTGKRTFVLFSAAVVMMQTIYWKIVIWNHDVTLYWGILAGIVCSIVYRQARPQCPCPQN